MKDNLVLDPYTVKNLFNKGVYWLPEGEGMELDKEIVSSEVSFNYKPITAVVSKSDYEQHRDFLLKIMGAVNVREEQLAIYMSIKEPFNYSSSIEKLLLFGISSEQITFQIPKVKYQVLNYQRSRVLLSDDLKDLQTQVDKKKMLWKALQEMFNV